MRPTSLICGSALLLGATCACCQSTSAVLLADGFATGNGKYATGALFNGVGGQNPSVPGFTSAWNQGSATNMQIATPGLTSSAISYETGGLVNIVGPTTTVATLARNIVAPAASTYYFSALCNRGNVTTITPGAYSLMGFGDTTVPALGSAASGLTGIYIGYSENGSVDSNGALDDFGDLVIRSRQLIGGSNVGVDTVLIDGQAISTFSTTYFVVAKLTVNASGVDLLNYWVNPTNLTSDAQMNNTALVGGSVPTNSISASTDLARLEFAESNFDGTVSFDEPRLATTLADLTAPTPVPEPCMALLAILTGGVFSIRRGRASN